MRTLRTLAQWVLVIAVGITGWKAGADHTDSNWRRLLHEDYVLKTEARYQKQLAVSEISKEYQERIATMEDQSKRTIDGLNAANKRLRIRVRDSGSANGDSGGCRFNGPAEIDGRDAQRLIAVSQKGDAWIKALQDTIRTLQQRGGEKTNGN